jgi:hypothetical protein
MTFGLRGHCNPGIPHRIGLPLQTIFINAHLLSTMWLEPMHSMSLSLSLSHRLSLICTHMRTRQLKGPLILASLSARTGANTSYPGFNVQVRPLALVVW